MNTHSIEIGDCCPRTLRYIAISAEALRLSPRRSRSA